MVLIEGIGAFSSPENSFQVQLASYATLLQSHQKISRSYDSLENAALARIKRGHLAIEEARILCRRGVIKQDNRLYWSHDRRLINMTPLNLTENQRLSCLKTITASTFLIWAINGFAFDKAIMKNRIAQIANLMWVNLTGRHHIHMEAPEVVIQHLVQFYDTINVN
jgi:hypothetical protein